MRKLPDSSLPNRLPHWTSVDQEKWPQALIDEVHGKGRDALDWLWARVERLKLLSQYSPEWQQVIRDMETTMEARISKLLDWGNWGDRE